MSTTRTYKFTPHFSPREIQDGAHCGETSYDVSYRTNIHEIIGTVSGNEILVDPNDESRGWVKEFYFVSTDGRIGMGSTRGKAIADAAAPAAKADCDWCYNDRTIDWKGAEAPCPVCSNGPAEAAPIAY